MKFLLPLAFISIAVAAPAPNAGPPTLQPLELPPVGWSELRVISPRFVELHYVSTLAEDAPPPPAPDARATSEYVLEVDGQPATITDVGFKRRVLYAPLKQRDLRISNFVYLRLNDPLPLDKTLTITARHERSKLWPGDLRFEGTSHPQRYAPALHVNQEGYAPGLPKIAMIGYYLGSLGELKIPQTDFELLDARTGRTVFKAPLLTRRDIGYNLSPRPYQAVWEANFSDFKEPGEYRLFVAGLGTSAPFRIDEGILMNFTRTYALGLYHQRCGVPNELPYTRFTHDACHTAPASVPVPTSQFRQAWTFIGKHNEDIKKAEHPAPRLKDESSQLFPFAQRGKIDVSGGHHDAGDYSKYTMNSAALIHALVFAVDALPGVKDLDNLGLPESGDGISDLLQEAKREADFLAKLQDTDGGFYFLVYPRERAYESEVTPDKGDPQVVWPKNTAATAAAVGALAQAAGSPEFKRRYPDVARKYLEQARRGWEFLERAIDQHGLAGSYQKLTHYGDIFSHYDELTWAAAEMFVATGEKKYHDQLLKWFPNPEDASTRRWGWWRAVFSFGNALRTYAFAARTGRLPGDKLDGGYLASCENELRRAGEDVLLWSQQNAYGTSFPEATKRQRAGGWYFSSDQAFDLTVAYQLDPKPAYAEAVLANLNFEAGTNPHNMSFITGLGLRQPRELVHQFAQADRRVLPPSGLPIGGLQASFGYIGHYKDQLKALSYPSDETGAIFPLYDRWSDAYNVQTEFVITNQGRSLASLAFWAAQTAAKSQPWKPVRAQLIAPNIASGGAEPLTFRLVSPELDLKDARIVWEARDTEPIVGETFTFTPTHGGPQWVEAEALLPDGRRVFAASTFTADVPVVHWVDGALPEGAEPLTVGGDTWDFQTPTSKPERLAKRTSRQHVSAGTEQLHEHSFNNAKAKLLLERDDVLFAHVYLDPANPPQAIMLSWNDGSWEHRAYWGADLFPYGKPDTPGRRRMGALPPSGRWIRLEVPVAAVNLAGKAVKGMSFSAYGGRVTWDSAGKATRED